MLLVYTASSEGSLKNAERARDKEMLNRVALLLGPRDKNKPMPRCIPGQGYLKDLKEFGYFLYVR